jgi:hypothetical protein
MIPGLCCIDTAKLSLTSYNPPTLSGSSLIGKMNDGFRKFMIRCLLPAAIPGLVQVANESPKRRGNVKSTESSLRSITAHCISRFLSQ